MVEQAIRLADVERGDLPVGLDTSRICYWRDPEQWWIYLPRAGSGGGGIGNLAAHTVEEHGDGTITVTPSIATWPAGKPRSSGRHGFLTRGEWREC